MKIHEYQAKKLLAQQFIPILEGEVVDTPEEAVQAAKKLGGNIWAIKAQIHAGGRGKGGGVKIANSLEQVRKYATQIFNKPLITPQTSVTGRVVKKIYVEQGCDIAKELYLSITFDRAKSCLLLIFSPFGGMNIEEIVKTDPDKIYKLHIDITKGIHPYQARSLAFQAGLHGKESIKIAQIIYQVYQAYFHFDASLIEINPLVITKEGSCLALDAKIIFDDNALGRHKKLQELRDISEESALEYEASKYDLSYVKLDGNIGCMVNGAGLAMATMDVIELFGAKAANFLDVGGGATQQNIEHALRIIIADHDVNGILVNIFGGIMQCDLIALAIVNTVNKMSIDIPVVIRLEGTNASEGKAILQNSSLKLITAETLEEAVRKMIKAVSNK